jgi:acyl-CoA reductase-like NAD-dependent aldehyde dehydrogenase
LDRIIFTGHTDVGRRIMTLASQRLTPITLELGGKDAMVILKDADLKRAARAACWGAFVNSGQTCVAVKRIYVEESLESRFTSLLLKEVSALRQGFDLDDPSVSMGSMISEEAVKEMEDQLARAVEQGAQVLAGGKRPDLKGCFFQPTVVRAEQHMDIVRKETFGPIVALMTFKGEEEAVTLANDSPFALNGSVWTSDMEKGRRIATTLRSGTITVNNVADTGFEELIERQHVHLDRGKFSSEIWWPPYGKEGMEAMHDFTGLAFNGERDGLLQKLLKARRLMRR